jgi:ATP-dependent DNA helicase PIF1
LENEKLATNAQEIDVPPVDTTPLKESTPGYIPMAFPTLFPDGAGDFYQPRLRKVELGEYFDHLLRFRGARFAQHRRFPWFSFNTLQRSRARSQSKIFVKQQHDAARLTAEDIRTMAAESDQKLASTMIRYGQHLRGTRAYWLARRHEVMDMTRDLNSPHLFFTLSAADLQWSDLHKHMPTNDPKEQFRRRKSALNSNPHIAAAYFDKRVQLFVKHFLTPLLGVVHFWYRYEWQERGSGHVHGFLWLKDAPTVDEIN